MSLVCSMSEENDAVFDITSFSIYLRIFTGYFVFENGTVKWRVRLSERVLTVSSFCLVMQGRVYMTTPML